MVMRETQGLELKIIEAKHDDPVEVVCEGDCEVRHSNTVDHEHKDEENGLNRGPSGERII